MIGKKVLILGGTGGIGQGTKTAFESEGAEVLAWGSADFQQYASIYDFNTGFLERIKPDIIVHCIGVIGADSRDYQETFDVNFGTVWHLLRYYLTNSQKDTNILIVGSSAYNRPSPNYMLYAASKAALVSMVSSMMVKFNDTKVVLNLLNPGKTNTNLRKEAVGEEPPETLLTPYEVGRKIVEIVKSGKRGQIIRLDKNG